ncbi:DNA/RNA non-specific endonuclease [Pseudoalteromonas luteoviolacea]|uniref:DNA/RNA non-specific endonuclease n=1 Tax=Pseudoalteromonas luteoviolacea TaxID=43657 RepID=UPI001F3417C4|nr:DNA/RNA non-specific endonuclease [Pseudoalteromonas luteoviolacea]MCF6440868.1 DNA/RNA non-specific endonuclease [Pseudoalteromonas luteoviolacea]
MMSNMDSTYSVDRQEQKQRDKAFRQQRYRSDEESPRYRERSPIRRPAFEIARTSSNMSVQDEEDIETIVLDDLDYVESISQDEYDSFIPILDQYSADLTSTEKVEEAIEVIGSSYFDVLLDPEQVQEVAQYYYQVVGARLSHIYKLLLPESRNVDFAFSAINEVALAEMPGAHLIQNFAYQYNPSVIGATFSINPAWNIAIPAGGSEERVRETTGADSINDTKIRFFAAKDFKYKDASGKDVTINTIVGDKVEARLSRLAPRGESAEVNADQSDLMKNVLVYNNNGNNANEKGWIRGHLLNDNLGGSALKFNLYPITGSANKEHHSRVESHVKNLVEAGYIVEYKVEVVPTVPAPHQKETAPGYKSGAAPKANLLCSVKVLSDTSTDTASSYHPEGSFSVTITSEYKTKHASSGDVSTLKAFANKAVKSKDNTVDSKAYMRPWTSKKGLTKPLGLSHKDDKHIRDKDYKDWTDKQKNSKFWTWDQTRIDALKTALKG